MGQKGLFLALFGPFSTFSVGGSSKGPSGVPLVATQAFFERRDTQDAKNAIGGLPNPLGEWPFDLTREAFLAKIDHFGGFGV